MLMSSLCIFVYMFMYTYVTLVSKASGILGAKIRSSRRLAVSRSAFRNDPPAVRDLHVPFVSTYTLCHCFLGKDG